MALEDELRANTAAITALTKQLQGQKPGGGTTTAAAGTTTATKPAGTKPAAGKPAKKTRKEVVDIAMRIKAEISEDSAKNLIAKFANGGQIKDMPEANYGAFHAAAEAALASGEEIEAEAGDEGEGDGDL